MIDNNVISSFYKNGNSCHIGALSNVKTKTGANLLFHNCVVDNNVTSVLIAKIKPKTNKVSLLVKHTDREVLKSILLVRFIGMLSNVSITDKESLSMLD